jgi:hypothetical protein
MARLDGFDRKIIAALQENGRLSNIDVAQRIGLSHSSCSRRIARLEREGVIVGYRALTDRQKLGLSVRAYCGVLREAETGWEELAQRLAIIDGVVSVFAVSGGRRPDAGDRGPGHAALLPGRPPGRVQHQRGDGHAQLLRARGGQVDLLRPTGQGPQEVVDTPEWGRWRRRPRSRKTQRCQRAT